MSSSFRFGKHSEEQLATVHPDLQRVCRKALELSTQDFTVFEGARSLETQRKYFETGVSQTMNSRHLGQDDGWGHAVDLVPYVAGGMRWELPPMYRVVVAMRYAARAEEVIVRWGGNWQVLNPTVQSPAALIAEYVDERRRQHSTPFVDAWHFELMRGA